jgi:hypothetical protein
MKKINMKKSKLVIKNKSLLKEGWGDAAGSSATSGEWKKIATVAIGGAQAFLSRSWSTSFVLPWKLYNAFKNGESLTQVMENWEATDKSLKDAQENIISKSGVEGTVDAFIGVCSPGMLIGQKWCEYTDRSGRADRWKNGASEVWNKTIAKNNPDLQVIVDVNNKVFNSLIVYSNFIKTISDLIGVKNGAAKYDDYTDFEKSGRKWKDYISIADSLGSENAKVKSFFRYLIYLQTDTPQNVRYKSETLTSYLKKNQTGDSKLKALNSEFLKVMGSTRKSASQASKLIQGNNIAPQLDIISNFIENAQGIDQNFKNYISSGIDKKKPEPKPKPATVTSSVKESIKFKKLNIRSNKISKNILKEAESVDSEIAGKELIKDLGRYATDSYIMLNSVREMVVYEIVLQKIKNTYYVYNNFLKSLESNKEVSGLKSEPSFSSRKSQLLNVLSETEKFMDKLKENFNFKTIEVVKLPNDLLKALKEEDKIDATTVNAFKKDTEDQDKNLMDNKAVGQIVNQLALHFLKGKEEAPTEAQIAEEENRIKVAIGNQDRLKMAYLLASGTAMQFWSSEVSQKELSTHKELVVKLKNNFNEIQKDSNKVSESLKGPLKDSDLLKAFDNPEVKMLLDYYNNSLSDDFSSDIDEMIQRQYVGIKKSAIEQIEKLLIASSKENEDQDSTENEETEGNVIDISGNSSVTIAKTRNK